MERLFAPFTERIIQKYADQLLRYIESIDWHRDGIEAPDITDSKVKSIRKVFNAIGYIKSEIDDLLKERDAVEQVLRESETMVPAAGRACKSRYSGV